MPGNDGIEENEQKNTKEAQQFSAHFIIIIKGKEWIAAKQCAIIEFATGPMQAMASTATLNIFNC